MDLTAAALAAGYDAGCTAVGVCSADPFPEVAAQVHRRKRDGLSARLGFTFADPDTATDVRASLPWARSLVVAAHPYLPAAGNPGPPSRGAGRVARFAAIDGYGPLRSALLAIAEVLRRAGCRAEVLCDDSRLVDRAAAARAGIGWWGKNTMILTPGAGPWVLLGSVVTDAALDAGSPMRRSCGSCSACLPACPTGALVAPGVLDARRCLAYWLQAPGTIPYELRSFVADRVYGCDDCLEACPPGHRLLGEAAAERGRVDLEALLASTDAELLAAHAHFFLPGRRPRFLRRNALVAMGNVGGSEAVATLAGYAGHPDALLRAHAVWALGRVGGARAGAVLAQARRDETISAVVDEIDLAIESR